MTVDQLGGEGRKDLEFSLRVAPVEGDVLPFDVAKIVQLLRERLVPLYTGPHLVGQDAHSRDLRELLRIG